MKRHPRNSFSAAMQKGEMANMKMQDIRKIAVTWGVDIRIGRSKKDIIRDIQIREGYSPCYATKEVCEQDCLWKDDCLRLSRSMV
jgi:hypothetical protein